MTGGLHRSAIHELESWTAPDQDQERLRARFLAHLAAHDDGLDRACAPEHLTASLLVLSVEADQALLTLHARAGRWFQFGGHLEPGDESLAEGAVREGVEESGIPTLELVPGGPLLLDAHPVTCRNPAARRHLDVQYLALASSAGAISVSSESLAVRWWPLLELPADRSVRALSAEALRRLDA